MQKRCLYIAFACHPDKGSEAGRGWDWLKYLSQSHKIDLLTPFDPQKASRIAEEIKKTSSMEENITTHFLPFSIPKNPLFSQIQEDFKPLYYHYYQKWLSSALSYCQELKKASPQTFGLVHHCNYATFRNPGAFWTLGIPSLWGPVCGFHNLPYLFLPSFPPKEALRYTFRNLVNAFHLKFNKRTRLALKSYTHTLFKSPPPPAFPIPSEKVVVIPGQMTNPITPPQWPLAREKKSSDGALHFCFAGQQVFRKGGHLLLQAFSNAVTKSPLPLHLHIIGGDALKLQTRFRQTPFIHWHGQQSRKNTLAIMESCDVFTLLSLLDSHPTVLAEALSLSLPILTTNLPEIGDMISSDCGYILEAESPKQLVQAAEEAILDLASNPQKLKTLKIGSGKRAEELAFQTHMPKLQNLYQKYLENPSEALA